MRPIKFYGFFLNMLSITTLASPSAFAKQSLLVMYCKLHCYWCASVRELPQIPNLITAISKEFCLVIINFYSYCYVTDSGLNVMDFCCLAKCCHADFSQKCKNKLDPTHTIYQLLYSVFTLTAVCLMLFQDGFTLTVCQFISNER